MVCFIFEKRLVLINVNSTLFHEIDFLAKFKPKYEAQNRIGFQVWQQCVGNNFCQMKEGSNIPDFFKILKSSDICIS